MAKSKRSVKTTDVSGPNGSGMSYEHQESIDDNLLPDANELERLQKLDPDIMNWIKETTSAEQLSRHDFNSRKMGIIEKAQRLSFRIDRIKSFYAFAIIIAGMGFSTYLLNSGKDVIGTVFAGGTMIVAVVAFLGKPKENRTNN